MAITWTDVTDIAPELSTVAVGRQNAILADVALQVNATAWGDKYNMGMKYLAAHIASLPSGAGVAAGALTGVTVGQVSRTYAAPSSSSRFSELDRTSYGQRYKALQRQLIYRAAVT